MTSEQTTWHLKYAFKIKASVCATSNVFAFYLQERAIASGQSGNGPGPLALDIFPIFSESLPSVQFQDFDESKLT